MRPTTPKTFDDLPYLQQEKWCEKATDWLLVNLRIPMSDDVWATDKYADEIYEKANEMWEESFAPKN